MRPTCRRRSTGRSRSSPASRWSATASSRGEDLFACVLEVLRREHSPAVVEPFLNVALELAQRWTPSDRIAERLQQLAEVAAGLADDPDLTTPALRTLAAAASTDEHLALLDRAAGSDVDLAWRVAIRRAAIGRYDEDTVEALLERDPDPDAPDPSPGGPHRPALLGGQGRGVDRAVREEERAGWPDAGCPDPGVLAARAGRPAAALRRPLPRRGPAAGRRRHADGVRADVRDVPAGRRPGVPGACRRAWPRTPPATRPSGPRS